MSLSEAMPAAVLWRDGWYRCAKILESPNFGPRPQQAHIDLVVLHCISLPPGEFDNQQVQRLFTNQLDFDAHPYFQKIRGLKVSAHFFISRSGELWQFVSCNNRAWHAGQSTYRGRSDCNDDSIGIELEGVEGNEFEASQYESLSAVCSALMAQFPVVHIAGHEHIAPGRKADPGTGFNWLQLQKSMAFPDSFLPPVLSRQIK